MVQLPEMLGGAGGGAVWLVEAEFAKDAGVGFISDVSRCNDLIVCLTEQILGSSRITTELVVVRASARSRPSFESTEITWNGIPSCFSRRAPRMARSNVPLPSLVTRFASCM